LTVISAGTEVTSGRSQQDYVFANLPMHAKIHQWVELALYQHAVQLEAAVKIGPTRMRDDRAGNPSV